MWGKPFLSLGLGIFGAIVIGFEIRLESGISRTEVLRQEAGRLEWIDCCKRVFRY
jgi:hypothetical protein